MFSINKKIRQNTQTWEEDVKTMIMTTQKHAIYAAQTITHNCNHVVTKQNDTVSKMQQARRESLYQQVDCYIHGLT